MALVTVMARSDLRRAILVVAAAALVVAIQLSASVGFRAWPILTTYHDFGSLWASGQAANAGLDPYDPYPLTYRVRTPRGEQAAVNLNPPFSVLLLQATARFNPDFMFRYWQVGSALLYVAIVLALVRRFPGPNAWQRALLMLAWHPFWSTLDLGQLYIALLLPVALANVLIDRHPRAAGICIGVAAALKPPLLLWPLLLLAARHWRPALVAFSTAGSLSVLPAVLGHSAWYLDWIEATRAAQGTLVISDNLAWLSVPARFGVPLPVGLALIGMVVAALIAGIAWRRPDAARVSAIALVAALAASPITWVGYGVLLVPVFLAQPRWSEPLLLAALLFAIPGPVLWWTIESGFVIYELALVLALIAVLRGDGLDHRSESFPLASPPIRHVPRSIPEAW